MAEFCKVCGSLIINGNCSNVACPAKDNSLCLWVINGREYRFKRPLKRAEAEQAVKENADVVLRMPVPKVEPDNRFIKPRTGDNWQWE